MKTVLKMVVVGAILLPSISLAAPFEVVRPNMSALIEDGDAWSYYRLLGAPAAGWMTGKESKGWGEGATPIGWGERDLKTQFTTDGDAAARFPIAYFRKKFTYSAELKSKKKDIRLFMNCDDGCIAFINGKEIGRLNLPAGKFGKYEGAKLNHEGLNFLVKSSDLRPGENTIAVEVHQGSPTSSDMIFTARLAYR